MNRREIRNAKKVCGFRAGEVVWFRFGYMGRIRIQVGKAWVVAVEDYNGFLSRGYVSLRNQEQGGRTSSLPSNRLFRTPEEAAGGPVYVVGAW